MPGMFCEAIVTMNSGSPMPTMAAPVKCGAISVGCGQSDPMAAASIWLEAITRIAVTSTAAGTA